MRLSNRRIARRSRAAERPRKRRATTRRERPARRRGPAPRSSLGSVSRGAARTLGFAERHITPARGLTVVALAAVISLGVSQFGDYRAVEVGAPEYASLGEGAKAPQIEQRSPRSPHGDWVLAIAIAALLVLAAAVARNWRLARLLIFLGAAVVAISLSVDAPQGLREGTAGIAFQGARATLLGSFWVQLFSAVTLIVVGPILALELRAQRDAKRDRRRRGARRAGSGALRASGSRVEEART